MPELSTETEALLTCLNVQSSQVMQILVGLDEEALRRRVLPSGWSSLGLVRHLAMDDERFWFRGVIAGEPAVIEELSSAPDDAWAVPVGVPGSAVFELYRQQIQLANAVLINTALDAPPRWWPERQFGDWRLANVREVVLHVIVETARHAGHLDAVRELIDGRTGV